MGFSAQVQNNQTGGGKVSALPNQGQIDPSPKDGSSGHIPFESNGMPQGKGGRSFTYSPTSGQQTMGSPNPYPNTIGMGDNQSNQKMGFGGKGKGGFASAPSGDSMGYGGSNSLIENTYHPESANKP